MDYHDFWVNNEWKERLINVNKNSVSIINEDNVNYNLTYSGFDWRTNFIPAKFDKNTAPFKPLLWTIHNVWISSSQDVSKLDYNKPVFYVKWKITNYISNWISSRWVVPSWWWQHAKLKNESDWTGTPIIFHDWWDKRLIWASSSHVECYVVLPAWCWDGHTDSSYWESCDNGTDNWDGIGNPVKKNGVACNNSCQIVQPTCGTANKTYSAADTSYGSDTFCSKTYETVNPANPVFPSKWWSSSWTCSLWNQTVNCTASRNNDNNNWWW